MILFFFFLLFYITCWMNIFSFFFLYFFFSVSSFSPVKQEAGDFFNQGIPKKRSEKRGSGRFLSRSIFFFFSPFSPMKR